MKLMKPQGDTFNKATRNAITFGARKDHGLDLRWVSKQGFVLYPTDPHCDLMGFQSPPLLNAPTNFYQFDVSRGEKRAGVFEVDKIATSVGEEEAAFFRKNWDDFSRFPVYFDESQDPSKIRVTMLPSIKWRASEYEEVSFVKVCLLVAEPLDVRDLLAVTQVRLANCYQLTFEADVSLVQKMSAQDKKKPVFYVTGSQTVISMQKGKLVREDY